MVRPIGVVMLACLLFAAAICWGQQPGELGSIAGRVVDAQSGRPLAGLLMWAESKAVVDGQMHAGAVHAWALTDTEGRYEIKGLAQAEYFLRVENLARAGMRSGEERQSATPHYRVTYFQNGRDWYSATTLTLRAGERLAGADFSLTPEDTFYARGTLESVGAVRMYLKDEPDRQNGLAGGSPGQLGPGPFEIGPIWAGQYWLYAYSGKRFEPGFRSSFMRVQVPGKESEQLAVVMAPAFPVEVRLRVDGDRAAPWMEADVRLMIVFDPVLSNEFSLPIRATVSTIGSARLDRVSPEPYAVTVDGLRRGWAVKSIAYNGGVLPEPIVEFSAAASEQRLEITVAPVNNVLAIQVLEKGRHMAMGGAMVTLAPEWFQRRWSPRSRLQWIAPAGGVLERRMIPPGKYRAVALPAGSLWNRAIQIIYDGGGEPVEVTDSSVQSVMLEVKR